MGNALNHANFPEASSGDVFYAGSAQVKYKIYAYLVYRDLDKRINVIPDPALPATTIFRISTIPPLESILVLKKVANRLDSVTGV